MAAHPTAGGVAPLYNAKTPYRAAVERNRYALRCASHLVSDCLHKRIERSVIGSRGRTLESGLDGVKPFDVTPRTLSAPFAHT
jgi:hypothetical protein